MAKLDEQIKTMAGYFAADCEADGRLSLVLEVEHFITCSDGRAADFAAAYGNQIGLATGLVNEIYHPDYVAKRMEIGAVMAAAPRSNVIRETSDPGDIIILLGGRTGRDGCGGATGSSKAHNSQSIDTCGAEVQKGNAPTERKLQRLFRRPEVSRLIKKCNDFGAGGVSVAIGELAAETDSKKFEESNS